MTDVMITRCTFRDVSRRLLRWMSRSMYTRASTKHSGLQDAYLFILRCGHGGSGGGEASLRITAGSTASHLSRYSLIEIDGGLRA